MKKEEKKEQRKKDRRRKKRMIVSIDSRLINQTLLDSFLSASAYN